MALEGSLGARTTADVEATVEKEAHRVTSDEGHLACGNGLAI